MIPARWTPKPEVLTLDGIAPDQHPLFRYILTRNGHNVSLYGGPEKAQADLRDRALRFPADDWAVIDRFPETLCVCCSHGQHGSHLIGAKCDCLCHPSNQRKAARAERKPIDAAKAIQTADNARCL